MAAAGQPFQGAKCQLEGCGQPAAVAVIYFDGPDMDLLCYADLMGMMSASMAEWAAKHAAEQQTPAPTGG